MSIFSSIGHFLAQIVAQIEKLWNNLPQELQVAVGIGAEATQLIKTVVDSPEIDILTAIIPGTVDDYIKNKLREELPDVLVKMQLVGNCAGLDDPIAVTACAVKAIQELDPSVQGGFLHQLSIQIAQIASDGRLTWDDGVYLLQWYYKNKFQAAANA